MTAFSWRREGRALALIAGVFALAFFLPVGRDRFDGAVIEALQLLRWYAREHVLLCLVPAFFIAGAIGVFLRKDAVMRYLGPGAPKPLAYAVASVSGSVLAVCSCTVLPLFAGIYGMGAGLGPASAFLYAGPAINVLAIILTARVLGVEMGVARAVGAVVFSVVIGLAMALLFRETRGARAQAVDLADEEPDRPLHRTVLSLAAMLAVLIFANWGAPAGGDGLWRAIHAARWPLTATAALALGVMLARWFSLAWRELALIALPVAALALWGPARPLLPFGAAVLLLAWRLGRRPADDPLGEWFASTWGFARQILPLLFAGILAAGLMLGRPGGEGLIPAGWVARAVGGNALGANLFAAIAGAFMYFATLTEIPILQGLLGAGMGKGPALALLLAGPALSLPSMLVIAGVLGLRKTLVFILLVVAMATLTGLAYGALF
ncbi:MAG: permease [Candidatus Krumholzibacteriia bacterium]|nr:permease [Candidatus Latescibacterota bacterium]